MPRFQKWMFYAVFLAAILDDYLVNNLPSEFCPELSGHGFTLLVYCLASLLSSVSTPTSPCSGPISSCCFLQVKSSGLTAAFF